MNKEITITTTQETTLEISKEEIIKLIEKAYRIKFPFNIKIYTKDYEDEETEIDCDSPIFVSFSETSVDNL